MSAPAFTPRDVEIDLAAMIADELAPDWPGLWVGRKPPADKRMQRMVLIRRQGGYAASPLVDAPRVGITTWAPTDAECNRLALAVHGALRRLERTSRLSRLRITGPSDITDADTDAPRRFLSADFIIRIP